MSSDPSRPSVHWASLPRLDRSMGKQATLCLWYSDYGLFSITLMTMETLRNIWISYIPTSPLGVFITGCYLLRGLVYIILTFRVFIIHWFFLVFLRDTIDNLTGTIYISQSFLHLAFLKRCSFLWDFYSFLYSCGFRDLFFSVKWVDIEMTLVIHFQFMIHSHTISLIVFSYK